MSFSRGAAEVGLGSRSLVRPRVVVEVAGVERPGGVESTLGRVSWSSGAALALEGEGWLEEDRGVSVGAGGPGGFVSMVCDMEARGEQGNGEPARRVFITTKHRSTMRVSTNQANESIILGVISLLSFGKEESPGVQGRCGNSGKRSQLLRDPDRLQMGQESNRGVLMVRTMEGTAHLGYW